MYSNPLQRSWQSLDLGVRMKATAVLLLLSGLSSLSVFVLPPAIQLGRTLIVLSLVSGGLLVGLAAGMLAKHPFAWPLGFVTIAFSGLSFMLQPWLFPTDRIATNQTITRVFCLVGGLIVSALWMRIWYRQRDYFRPAKTEQ